VVKGRAPVGHRARPAPSRAQAPTPLSDREIEELERLLDTVPAPLEPLDVSSLDGFLCGVLVQPERVPRERWLACITDQEGRALPRGFDAARLHALAQRRHAELDAAIEGRRWFDPWVFELDDADPAGAVFPWVAGIAAAFELFPGVMRLPAADTLEPLALLYRHLDADDLEDADELIAEIETLEPAADLEEAVEGLVRATLLLADLTRPLRRLLR
jgi:uncharacterized protein